MNRLKELGCSEKLVAHLAARHRGGLNSSEGHAYQRAFVVWKLLELAHHFRDRDAPVMVTSEAMCPVDDVVVESDRHEHYQLKLGANETWAKDARKLVKEFRQQLRLLRGVRVRFRLGLVTPHPHRKQHFEREMPSSLSTCTDIVLFPMVRPPDRPWSTTPTREAVEQLCAVNGRSSSTRELVYTAFAAAADTVVGEDRTVFLRDVLNKVRENPAVPLKTALSQEKTRDVSAALSLLNKVPNLAVTLEDGVCTYTIGDGRERGVVGRCDTLHFDRFIQRVLQRQPVTVDAFYEELP